MITYDKSLWGNRALFRVYGSAFPRSLPYAALASCIAVTLAALFQTTGWELFHNPYPIQLFFFVVGFIVVFRNNLSYARYWEGRSQLQQMTGRLTEAVRTTLNFDRITLPDSKSTEEEAEEHRWFCDTLIHLVSLFHAVALATLRSDYDMENLTVHDSLSKAPPTNARMLAKSRTKDGHRLTWRQPAGADSLGGISEGGDCGRDGSGPDQSGETGFRSTRGQTVLVNAWAGSKGIMDYFVLRAGPAHAKDIYRSMKLPVIGGLTQAEGEALGAFSTNSDLGVHGIMLENGTYTPGHTERAQAIASWIHECIVERMRAAGDRCPVSHENLQIFGFVHLESAFIAFEHCQKLTDTPIPFPWVQAINAALLIFTILAPIAIVAFIKSLVLSGILTFMVVSTYVTLNEVALDIEDPFHYDPNELPLPQMQYRLNERLLAILYSERPVAFTDMGGLTGPGNTVAVTDASGQVAVEGAPRLSPALEAAAGGQPAIPPAGAGTRFFAATQAAFASHVAAAPTASGCPACTGFLARRVNVHRNQLKLSDLRSLPVSATTTTPATGVAARWRFAAAAARAHNVAPAMVHAESIAPVHRDSTPSDMRSFERGESPGDPSQSVPRSLTSTDGNVGGGCNTVPPCPLAPLTAVGTRHTSQQRPRLSEISAIDARKR